MATMVTSSASPGKKLIQYLPDSRCVKPLDISRPSEGDVIGMPNPKNDNVTCVKKLIQFE